MKVAVFGGSFDPPHIGHVEVIKSIQEELDIDKLFVVPTHLNPFKEEFFAPSELRFEWLEKLFTCKDIEIFDYEVKQQRQVSSFETITHLIKFYNLKKIYLVIGADNIASLHKWHKYEELKELVEFVVATRNELNLPEELKKLSINVKISSSKLRKQIDPTFLPKTIEDEIIAHYKEKNG